MSLGQLSRSAIKVLHLRLEFRILKGSLGFVTFSLASFSFFVLAIGFGKILEGGAKLPSNIGLFVFVLSMFGLFSFATYKLFTKKKVVCDPQELERKALAFAHLKEGYVSVADLALSEQISIDDAGQILDELVLKNVARVEVSGSGKLVYLFDAFIGADKSKTDTLEIAIENAKAATVKLKKERADEEAAVELSFEVNSDVNADVHSDY